MKSSLYSGKIEHRRFSPIKHEFSYWVSYYFLDIDDIPGLFNRPPFMTYNSPGLLSFWRKDYLGNPKEDLRTSVEKIILEKTGEQFKGKIYLLTNISYLGLCFNPVSFYYCYDEDQKLRHVLAEVTNTPWGEKHQYLSPAAPDKEKSIATFRKKFHVSPFMPMNMSYTWVFTHPNERIYFLMQNRNEGESSIVFDSTLSLTKQELSLKNAMRLFLAYPFVTAKTILAIYYQAILLYFRKAPFYTHPDKVKS